MNIGSARSFFRAGSTWKWLLLLATLVFGIPLGSSHADGGPGNLILSELNPKTLPITFDPDDNDKDVSYKSKSAYKPATILTGGAKKDLRTMMRAKKDGAAMRARMGQQISTDDMDYRVRVAFDPDKTTGLIGGTSLAFFDFEQIGALPADGGGSLLRLEAVYNAGIEGFTVRATDGTKPLGIEIDVEDAEVVLRLRLAGGTLFMEAGAPTGPFVSDIDTTELHNEALGADGSGEHTFAWGVSGLDKAARMYFTHLGLWGALPDIGVAETPIAQQLIDATLEVTDALYPKDVASATGTMEATRVLLVAVVADLTAAVDGGLFNATAQGEKALKNAQKALKLAGMAKASGDKMLAAGKTNTKPLGKKARAITLRTILALVQVGGFRSNSAKKAIKTASFF